MPRRTTDYDNNVEDTFSDDDFESWETIAESFGTKLEWTIGTKFVGVFTGTRVVPQDDDDDATAAEFTRNGEKFYSWMPFALKKVIDDGTLKPGDTVFIHCNGEEPTKRNLNMVKTFIIKVKPA